MPITCFFAAAASANKVTGIGSGYTGRTNSFGNRTMDRYVAATGSYSATATQNGNAWSMQLVAFKADPVLADTTAPSVTITAPTAGAQVSDIVNVTAAATDNIGVIGVQFRVDGVNSGQEDTAEPVQRLWDTRTASNGTHTLTAPPEMRPAIPSSPHPSASLSPTATSSKTMGIGPPTPANRH